MIDRPDLAALGTELQRELRLQDWQVSYAYVRDLRTDQFQAIAEGCEPEGAPVYGLCNRVVDNKTATILVRDPSDPLPAGVEAKPVEAILMHELVHLHMAPLSVNTQQGIAAEEQAVWPIAEALARWRGTSRGEMVARAMALGAGKQRVGAKGATRSRSMNRSELAMLKAAMGDGKDPAAALANVQAALAAYEKTMPAEGTEGAGEKPPESESEEAKKAKAARAEAEEAERKAKAARAAAADEPPKPPAAAMTAAEVRGVALAVVNEHSERAALIAANAEKLGPVMCQTLATLPLAQVKPLVAARLADAPKDPPRPAAGQRAARVVVPPVDGAPPVPAHLADAFGRMDALMNTGQEERPPIVVDSRGMKLSHLAPMTVAEYVRKQSAAQGRG